MPHLDQTTAEQIINELPPQAQQEINAIVADNLADVFPAASLSVVKNGVMVVNTAWGFIVPETQNFPTQPDSLFDVASITKVFTFTTFLSLLSEHGLSLDSPLVDVVPEFGSSGLRPIDGGQDPHTKEYLPTPPELDGQGVDPAQVTFRHLITHTSGLSPWRAVYQAAGPAPLSPEQVDPVSRQERWAKALHALCNYAFVDHPGGRVRYSDLGLMLLGEATSRLNGTPGELDKAIAARVLNPLNLQSGIYNPLQAGRNLNTIVPTEEDAIWRKRRAWGEVHDENACGVGGVAGHAGIFATARDIAALGQAWLDDDSRLAIAPHILAQARQEQARNGFRFGLGWMLRAESDSSSSNEFSVSSYGHTGFTGTSLWIDPEQHLVVACLTNRVYPGREKAGIHEFRQALHAALARALRT